jgi:hypothetical protein
MEFRNQPRQAVMVGSLIDNSFHSKSFFENDRPRLADLAQAAKLGDKASNSDNIETTLRGNDQTLSRPQTKTGAERLLPATSTNLPACHNSSVFRRIRFRF